MRPPTHRSRPIPLRPCLVPATPCTVEAAWRILTEVQPEGDGVQQSDRVQAAWSRLVSARRAGQTRPADDASEDQTELTAAHIAADAEALLLAAAIDRHMAIRYRRAAALLEQQPGAPTLRAACDAAGIPFGDLGLPIGFPPGDLPDLLITARELLAWLTTHPSTLPPAPGEVA